MRGLRLTAAVALAAAALGTAFVLARRSRPPLAIHVRREQLVNGAGRSVRLFGVDRSGTEYACVIGGRAGAGIFSGPHDAASIAVMASWHVNAVRVSLNEDCWLGINGVNPAYSGRSYRDAIAQYVRELNDSGLVAIVDLHWSAPGGSLSDRQQVMADADHAPAFWVSVASRFRATPAVMFDLFNEPTDISWSCLRSGCVTGDGWRTAGMQSLVDAVRSAGARQPVIATGLDHANDLSGWLANPLHDPLHQLVAGVHVYDVHSPGYCDTVACWDRTLAPVAARVPIVTSELGERDGGTRLIDAYTGWADSQWRSRRSVSVLAWSWDAAQGTGGPSLITSYDGTPTTFGVGFLTYLDGQSAQGRIHQG